MPDDRLRNPLSDFVSNFEDRELRRRTHAQGAPYLAWRDGRGRLATYVLSPIDRLVIGAGETSSQIILSWDAYVSETHAELSRSGTVWRIEDIAASNRTSIQRTPPGGGDPEMIVLADQQRERLVPDDLIQIGATWLIYVDPNVRAERRKTELKAPPPPPITPTDAQRRVLVVLCEPYLRGDEHPSTPSNREIAARLHILTGTVVTHLVAMYDLFGIRDLGRRQRREALAKLAIAQGIVGPGHL